MGLPAIRHAVLLTTILLATGFAHAQGPPAADASRRGEVAQSRQQPSMTPFEYTTSWVGNTFGGKDGKFVQMDARTLFVAPDGTCFLNVPWEEDGNNAGIYRDGQHISNPGRTHGWGNGGGLAVVANDKYVFIAQSRNSEGGHLHERDPESYPPGDRNWFGLTRRTIASGGKEAAPAPAGRGSGKAIQGMGDDKLAQLAGAFLVINDVPRGREHPAAPIRGLALDNQRQRLYVSNPFRSEIAVFDSESLEHVAAWPVEDSRQMAVGPDGSVWVVQGKLDVWGQPEGEFEGAPNRWAQLSSQQLSGLARIIRFSPDGEQLPQVIEAVDLPTGLAFDPQGRLLVADNGPDQQIRIFDVSGVAPTQVTTFGEQGGIYAGVRGRIEPLKFNGLQGVGSDAQGNIYVVGNGFGGNGSGLTLESYTATGERNWALHGLEFVDVGDFDRANDGQNIFTPYERFAIDYTKSEPGREWSYQGYTMDRLRFPQDPRLNGRKHNTAWIRTIEGRRFMFGTDMYSGFVSIYRFEEGSEIAIPCGMFIGRTERNRMSFPPHRPEGRFIWVDHNGDGQFDAHEFEHDGNNDPTTWAWWVDSRGHVWQGYQNATGIIEFPVVNINEHGVPVYRREHAVEHTLPAPFDRPGDGSRVERVQYYPEQDVMYISGYTPEMPAPQGAWKNAGRVIVRYENWNTQPRKVWEIHPKFEWHDAVPRRITPASFDAAGDLFFVIEGRYAATTIYDAATGVALAQISPGPEVGKFSGWIDIPYGINAMQRDDGEYLLLAEEDGRAKNLLYRFRKPDAVTPDAAASLNAHPGAGHVTLQWTGSPAAAGYVVERARQSSGGFERVAVVTNALAWRDDRATPGEAFDYRVTAVGWGGPSPVSQTVAATAGDAQPHDILLEDFEGGSTTLRGVQIVPMPQPALPDGGRFVGQLRQTNGLPVNGVAVPPGATHVAIFYDRLFQQAPGDRVHTHYTRQYLRFNSTGDQRHGEHQRFVLRDEDAGKWTKIECRIAIPAGAARITGGELANIAERPADGYDNPVSIDNLRIAFE
jgi:hypothetical protein